jgi:hypothetical protein
MIQNIHFPKHPLENLDIKKPPKTTNHHDLGSPQLSIENLDIKKPPKTTNHHDLGSHTSQNKMTKT